MFSNAKHSLGFVILRLIVGIVFLAHGWQKVFVFGLHGVTGMFTHMGVPAPSISAPLIMLIEFLGGIALILGVGTRIAALLLAMDMLGAILLVHWKNGFFAPGGVEFPLTLLAATACLALVGAGEFSLDRRLRGKKLL